MPPKKRQANRNFVGLRRGGGRPAVLPSPATVSPPRPPDRPRADPRVLWQATEASDRAGVSQGPWLVRRRPRPVRHRRTTEPGSEVTARPLPTLLIGCVSCIGANCGRRFFARRGRRALLQGGPSLIPSLPFPPLPNPPMCATSCPPSSTAFGAVGVVGGRGGCMGESHSPMHHRRTWCILPSRSRPLGGLPRSCRVFVVVVFVSSASSPFRPSKPHPNPITWCRMALRSLQPLPNPRCFWPIFGSRLLNP